MSYEPVELRDYGTLRELTSMRSVTGPTEDAMVKMVPFHHNPPVSAPSP